MFRHFLGVLVAIALTSASATALTVAARSRAPIVVYAGDSDTGDELEDQFLDHRRFVDVTGAGFVRVHPGRDVERSVREAIAREAKGAAGR